jgi:SAM-dependent methyltransferase
MGSAEQFRTLRSALINLHYDEASICARTGVRSIFEFRTKSEQRQTGIELNDALDALIHLIMDGETLHCSHLRSLIAAPPIKALETMGVLGNVPDQPDLYYATVFLYPVASLYIASDRGTAIDKSDITSEREVVYPAITANTRRFLDSLPETRCESLLDLCSGSGIAAFAGAVRYAQHAWSCDLAERSVRFAEFNRRLNGIENAICLQGDLYQPVADLTFDRIVAHPPYVPSTEQEVLFRDGGEDGEQVLRGVIEGLPRHLRAGGRCYCQTMATDREGNSFEQRIRGWLGERGREFDVILVANSIRSKNEFLQDTRQNPKAADLGPLLSALKVTAVYYGAVILQRFTDARAPVTTRIRKASSAGREANEWFVGWTTAAAAPDFDAFLRRSRPHMSPHLILNVAHTVENGVLVPSRFELRSDFPFTVALAAGGWLTVAVSACDGQKTAGEIFEEMKQREAIPSETPEPQFLRDLRALISCGFLELDEFRLPEKPQAEAV